MLVYNLTASETNTEAGTPLTKHICVLRGLAAATRQSLLTPILGEDCFERAQEFIPERWTTQPSLIRNLSAYAPFGTGKILPHPPSSMRLPSFYPNFLALVPGLTLTPERSRPSQLSGPHTGQRHNAVRPSQNLAEVHFFCGRRSEQPQRHGFGKGSIYLKSWKAGSAITIAPEELKDVGLHVLMSNVRKSCAEFVWLLVTFILVFGVWQIVKLVYTKHRRWPNTVPLILLVPCGGEIQRCDLHVGFFMRLSTAMSPLA